jgi:hypothetical protein
MTILFVVVAFEKIIKSNQILLYLFDSCSVVLLMNDEE